MKDYEIVDKLLSLENKAVEIAGLHFLNEKDFVGVIHRDDVIALRDKHHWQYPDAIVWCGKAEIEWQINFHRLKMMKEDFAPNTLSLYTARIATCSLILGVISLCLWLCVNWTAIKNFYWGIIK